MTSDAWVEQFTYPLPEYGYTEPAEQTTQLLVVDGVVQAWADVPACVVISVGCFGDTGGWLSPFAGLADFGRKNEPGREWRARDFISQRKAMALMPPEAVRGREHVRSA